MNRGALIFGALGLVAVAGLARKGASPPAQGSGGASSGGSSGGGGASGPKQAPPAKVNAETARWAEGVARAAFVRTVGREPTGAELLYILGVGKYETTWGNAWTGAGKGSNNWGSVHATGSQDSFEWTDSHSDGTRYPQKMRKYATPEDGAADLVRHIIVLRPRVADALDDSGATLWRASLAMRRSAYYGSWCLKAVQKYGKGVASVAVQKNPTSEGDLACEREAVGLHVWRMSLETRGIALAVGDLAPIPDGTYEDALAWYSGRIAAAGEPPECAALGLPTQRGIA